LISHQEAELLLQQILSDRCDRERCGDAASAPLLAAAARHGVQELLWRMLTLSNVAPALRKALSPFVRTAVAREVFVQRELQSVTDALMAGGIPALLTKGAALAYTAYPEPWLRPRVDTDLLVRHGDFDAASRVLQRAGYVRSDATNTGALVSHQVAFERVDEHGIRHVLDLHWKAANPQLVADALLFDSLWRDARPATALGPAARVPSPVSSLALACVHRLAHHQGHHRLLWLYDIKLLAEGLSEGEWESLTELACSRGIATFCLDGLRASREQLGTTVPPDAEKRLADAAPHEPSSIYAEGTVTKRDILVTDLRVLTRWRDRIRLVREHAFPPAAFIQQRYGTRTRLLLPAFYLHRLITGASKWVRS
jgi:hypothetical protein